MRDAKQAGYRTLLIYVALADPELHIERVRLRVSQGGHDIPDSDIRRRYARSLSRAPKAIRLAEETLVLDNSGLQPERVLILRHGLITWRAESLPLMRISVAFVVPGQVPVMSWAQSVPVTNSNNMFPPNGPG